MTEFRQETPVHLADHRISHLFQIVEQGFFLHIGKIEDRADKKCVPLSDPKYLHLAESDESISAIITTPRLAQCINRPVGIAVSDNPFETLCKVYITLFQDGLYSRTAKPTKIAKSVKVDPTAYIAPQNVTIGAGSQVMRNASIRANTEIGQNCMIGENCVIGGEGFQVVTIDGSQQLLPQAGGVVIGNNSSILPNTTIARASFCGSTEIGERVTIDSNVHIGHDTIVGNSSLIASGTVLSGRVCVGEKVVIGPNATISNGLYLGDNSIITLGSVVVRNVKPGGRVTGNFAIPHLDFLKSFSKKIVRQLD